MRFAINISHLVRVIESGDWSLLRREPPYFLGIVNAVHDLEKLVTNVSWQSFTGQPYRNQDWLTDARLTAAPVCPAPLPTSEGP